MKKTITKRGLKARKTWIKKLQAQYQCECRGHKEIINSNDCICSPHDGKDLGKCNQSEGK